MNFKIEIKPLLSQPDLCTEDFEVCKKCDTLGAKGDKARGWKKCSRFKSDDKRDDHCGMSLGHGRHRCNVSMNHFEVA